MSDDHDRDRADERHVIVEDETLAAGFTQIPNGVLRRSDLQPGAKLTYMVLLSYAWQKDHAYPGQDVLARDMGVTDRSVRTYLDQLEATGLVSIQRRGLGKTNVYILHRIRPENSSDQDRKPGSAPEVQDFPPKKTQGKKTQRDLSKGPLPRQMVSLNDRGTIERFVEDYAREFRDQAPLKSSVTRAVNIYADSGLELDPFLDIMQNARAMTQRLSGGILTEVADGSGHKAKMGYWFRVLEDLVSRAA